MRVWYGSLQSKSKESSPDQPCDVHINLMISNTCYVSIQGLHPSRPALLPDYMTFCTTRLPKSSSPSNAAGECSLHFLDLKAAPGGSFVSQHFLKCVVTWLFLRDRKWSNNGWDKLPLANESKIEAATVNGAAGHLLLVRLAYLLTLSSSCPQRTQPLQTA